jgi:hypothetical protein
MRGARTLKLFCQLGTLMLKIILGSGRPLQTQLPGAKLDV